MSVTNETKSLNPKQTIRPVLLVIASTFPRWPDDTLPPFVFELSKRLTDTFEVHLLAPAYPGAKDQETMEKIHVHRFRYFFRSLEKLAGGDGILPTLKKNRAYYLLVPFFLLGEYLALRRLVKELKPTAIHAHWIIPQGLIVWLLSLITQVKYIVTSHGSDIFGLQGKLLSTLKRKVLLKAEKTTVVSNAIKHEVHRTLDPAIAVEVISMGVDGALFNLKQRDEQVRRDHDISGPFLLFVGRLAEVKGVRYLLEAMPTVLAKHPTTRLMIIGKGPLEAELKAQAHTLKISKQVIFMGAIPNSELPKYYATADIFIGPSIRTAAGETEGFGLTFVEAGMSGAWLIGSDMGGIRDIIQEGVNGDLFEEKNTDQLAQKINAKIEKSREQDLSIRVKCVAKYDWTNISANYNALLSQLGIIETYNDSSK